MEDRPGGVLAAGPAGVAVAAGLAKQGRANSTLVLDRYTFPRPKPCGGALTGHMEPAMEKLGLLLRVPAVACGDAVVRFGSLERNVQMGKAVQVIRREDFDEDLVRQVRDLGVEVIEGEGLVRYEEQDGGVIVIHCHGGIGRSSLLAAAVLTLLGSAPVRALETIAAVRGRPVPDTEAQRAWLLRSAARRERCRG